MSKNGPKFEKKMWQIFWDLLHKLKNDIGTVFSSKTFSLVFLFYSWFPLISPENRVLNVPKWKKIKQKNMASFGLSSTCYWWTWYAVSCWSPCSGSPWTRWPPSSTAGTWGLPSAPSSALPSPRSVSVIYITCHHVILITKCCIRNILDYISVHH